MTTHYSIPKDFDHGGELVTQPVLAVEPSTLLSIAERVEVLLPGKSTGAARSKWRAVITLGKHRIWESSVFACEDDLAQDKCEEMVAQVLTIALTRAAVRA